MSLTTSPLTPHLGVELHGLDVSALSASDKTLIRELFDRHHLLLIRDLQLSADEQLALSEVIGPLSTADAIMKDGRKFMHISNVHADGRVPTGELLFHADHMFLETPLKAISLYALAVTSKGGETCFIDAAQAYRALPERLKRTIAPLKARHVYDYAANRGDGAPQVESLSSQADTAIHPVVWPHPESGEPILFVSPLLTAEILGVPKEESKALLDELCKHLESRRSDYSHRWQVGDVLIWDNRILQHARNDFDPREKRALRRIPIGERVVDRRATSSPSTSSDSAVLQND